MIYQAAIGYRPSWATKKQAVYPETEVHHHNHIEQRFRELVICAPYSVSLTIHTLS
jgi:hypothetical protein